MFIFRLAHADEAESVLQLYRAQIGRPGVTWDASYPAMENIRYDLSVQGLYVGEDDAGHILAAGFAGPTDDLTDPALAWDSRVSRWCDLARICVHPDLAGQGLSTKLLQHMIADTRARGFEGMRLLLVPGNIPACRLYARAGFRSLGRHEAYGHVYDRRELVYADLPLEK